MQYAKREIFPVSNKKAPSNNWLTCTKLFPNPIYEKATIRTQEHSIQNGLLRLFNAADQLAQQQAFSANEVLIEKRALQPGIYFFQILEDYQFIGSGRFIVH